MDSGVSAVLHPLGAASEGAARAEGTHSAQPLPKAAPRRAGRARPPEELADPVREATARPLALQAAQGRLPSPRLPTLDLEQGWRLAGCGRPGAAPRERAHSDIPKTSRDPTSSFGNHFFDQRLGAVLAARATCCTGKGVLCWPWPCRLGGWLGLSASCPGSWPLLRVCLSALVFLCVSVTSETNTLDSVATGTVSSHTELGEAGRGAASPAAGALCEAGTLPILMRF